MIETKKKYFYQPSLYIILEVNTISINKEKGSEEGILTALEDYAAIKFPTLGFQIKLKATDFAPKSVAFGNI